MSNLDAALTDRDQAALGEDVEHAPAVVAELVERDAPPHGRAAFLGGQPQQQAPGGDPLVRFEALVGRLGQPRHGAAHAPRALVRGEPHVAAVALLPQLQQRGRQQRQSPRFALAVREQPVRESGLESQSGVPRGQLDRAPQLVVVHRADEDVVGGQQRSELRICGAATVEVRAHSEDDGGSALADRTDQRGDERHALVLVPAGGEQLLELVDDEHGAAVAVRSRTAKLAHRVLAGTDQRAHPGIAAGQRAAGERGQQPGPHDATTCHCPTDRPRRAAASRRAGPRARPRAARGRRSTRRRRSRTGPAPCTDTAPGRAHRSERRDRRARAPPAARRRARPARPPAHVLRCPRRPRAPRRRRPGGRLRASPTRLPPRERSGRRRRSSASSASTGTSASAGA